MDELRILRGRDVHLLADDTELCGVTAVTASQKDIYHDVHEYLCYAPYDRVKQGTAYQIKLTVLSLFDRQLADRGSFTLSVLSDEMRYDYENCRVLEIQYNAQGNQNTSAVFLIEAERLVKQVTTDE